MSVSNSIQRDFSFLSLALRPGLLVAAVAVIGLAAQAAPPPRKPPKARPRPVWSTQTTMPTPRHNPGVAAFHQGLHVVGGWSTACESAHEIYDPKSDSWSAAASMPTPRVDLMLVAAAGKLYALGGWNSVPLTTNEAYDPRSDSWVSSASLPVPVSGAAVATIAGIIYVIGGYDGTSETDVVQIYDPLADAWSLGAPMLTARSETSGAVLDGRIYVVGGNSNSTPPDNIVDTVEVYDPLTDSWATVAPLPDPRTDLAVVSWKGRLLAIGGASTFWGETQGAVTIYDALTDSWTEGPPLPTPRQQVEAAVLGATVYVPGGAILANVGTGILEALSLH